jgi:hypothetical protein
MEDDLKNLEREDKAAHGKVKRHYDIELGRLTCKRCGFFTNSPIIAAAHLNNCPKI